MKDTAMDTDNIQAMSFFMAFQLVFNTSANTAGTERKASQCLDSSPTVSTNSHEPCISLLTFLRQFTNV